MNGLLDFLKTPAGQGLLSAGLGVAANAGRGGTWNAIGRGGLLGLQGYQGAIDSQRQQEDANAAREFRTMQMDKTRRDYATEDQIKALAPKFFTPGTQGAGATDQVNSALPPDLQIGALGAIPAQQPKFDTQGYAQALMAVDPKQGISLMQSMQKDTPFGKIDPKDYTQESIRQFSMTRNPADLVAVRKKDLGPGGQVLDLYNAQPGQVFNDPNKPFQIGAGGQLVPNTPFQQYETNKAKAGAARTDVRVENKMGDSLASQVGPMAKDSKIQTQGAVKMFDAATRIDKAIESGLVSAGPLTTQIQTVKQLVQKVGGGSDDGIRQTRQVIKSLAQMAVEARKQLQGQGQVTESEAAAVAKADAGDINDLTIGELKDLSTLTKRAAHFTAKGHQELLEQMRTGEGTRGVEKFYPVQGMDSLLNYKPTLPQIGGGSVRSQADAILRGSK